MKFLITEKQYGLITEARYKAYRKFIKDNLFNFLPDYVFNEAYKITDGFDYETVKNMDEEQTIEYFARGNGRRIYDRFSGYKNKKPTKIQISFDDLSEDLQDMVKSEEGPETSKIEKMKERNPSMGFGENEPILVKYDLDEKIVDIPSGVHRLFTAFELNNYEPVLMKAYVSYE